MTEEREPSLTEQRLFATSVCRQRDALSNALASAEVRIQLLEMELKELREAKSK